MGRVVLDTSENEARSSLWGKLNTMLTELYSSFGGATDPSVTTLTTSGDATIGGALAAASAAITAALTAATVTLTGLLTSGSFKLDTGTKTATATGGAATLSKSAGVITSEALTTAAAATYTLTLTNTTIAAADQVFASVQNGTNTQGIPVIGKITPGAGSCTIEVTNLHASQALNGTIKIAFAVLKN